MYFKKHDIGGAITLLYSPTGKVEEAYAIATFVADPQGARAYQAFQDGLGAMTPNDDGELPEVRCWNTGRYLVANGLDKLESWPSYSYR